MGRILHSSILTVACSLALLSPAHGAPGIARGTGFGRLGENGRGFLTHEAGLPLRCLDAPALLSLPVQEQEQLLDKAVMAGFNAVSFEALLFGPQALVPTVGKVDAARADALSRLVQACGRRRLYAFPVLWTPAAAEALVGKAATKLTFWSGKNSLGWQAWAVRELAKIKVEGRPLTGSVAVGGWLLYRGHWPGGSPGQGTAADTLTPSAEACMRNWSRWQVGLFRKAGFTQLVGLGLWAKQNLAVPVESEPAFSKRVIESSSAPFAPLSGGASSAGPSLAQVKELDVLPPVPGMETVTKGGADESAVGASPTPWDLEGLDWNRVDNFLGALPVSTQLDFIEFTLDTEDWYRVGDRLAEAASRAEVPVIWRQDWRSASRYERSKRLDAPAPLAGLAGPWPDDDWPGDGESIWPPIGQPVAGAPFKIGSVRLKKQGRRIQIATEMNKPGRLIVRWGRGWPLTKEVRSHGRPKTQFGLTLAGVAPGEKILVRIDAESQHSGSAVARTRWFEAPR